MLTLSLVPAWLLRAFAIALGLLFGSFLNVVIARLPEGESIVSPPSHCACGAPISARDNIPVLSWLVLGGRARCCGTAISPRYPLVEAMGGLVAWAILEVVVLSAPLDALLVPLLARAFVDLVLACGLLAAAFIDLEHMYLPDSITIGGTAVALASAGLRPELGYAHAALGMMIGFWGIYIPFIVLYRVLRGKPGMGMGDAKLMALVGAWFGWQGLLFVLFAASIQGTFAALAIYARHGRIAEPASVIAERAAAMAEGAPLDPESDPVALPPGPGLGSARIPFGPFLILAALELLLARGLLQRWFSWLVEA